jgi:hypothetical protein
MASECHLEFVLLPSTSCKFHLVGSEMWSVQLETINGRFLDQEAISLHLRCENDAIFP